MRLCLCLRMRLHLQFTTYHPPSPSPLPLTLVLVLIFTSGVDGGFALCLQVVFLFRAHLGHKPPRLHARPLPSLPYSTIPKKDKRKKERKKTNRKDRHSRALRVPRLWYMYLISDLWSHLFSYSFSPRPSLFRPWFYCMSLDLFNGDFPLLLPLPIPHLIAVHTWAAYSSTCTCTLLPGGNGNGNDSDSGKRGGKKTRGRKYILMEAVRFINPLYFVKRALIQSPFCF